VQVNMNDNEIEFFILNKLCNAITNTQPSDLT